MRLSGPAEKVARRRSSSSREFGGVENGYHAAVSVDELEAEVLKLDPQSRARLAEELLASLENLSEEESARLWTEEAARCNTAWDESAGDGKSAADVMRDARARLQ